MSTYLEAFDARKTALEMHQLIAELYPICRSITGNGVRESLRILQRYLPIEVHEIPTGTKVFDWIVPKEWNVRDAYVKDMNGKKVIDFQASNLHLLNYSIPVHKTIPLDDLKAHLFSLPDHPEWIPYRTSYYKEFWGFCLSHQTLQKLEDGEYEVKVDSSLEEGFLTYGEYLLPGTTTDEVLFTCHVCHPSLCNDNLSGISLVTFLAKQLKQHSRRYSYRFLFIPGTIGSITWLSRNQKHLSNIKHGLVVAGVGDPGNLTYKKSRQGNAEIDRAVVHVLKHSSCNYEVNDFSPYGYDERQFCSPGFNLPVGSLTRTPFDCYPEYHTSADNLEFVQVQSLENSLEAYLSVCNVLENNRTYLNTNPYCEPQLGKRGLYSTLGGKKLTKINEMALLWVLNLSDGSQTLLDIADRANLKFDLIQQTADALLASDLLVEC